MTMNKLKSLFSRGNMTSLTTLLGFAAGVVQVAATGTPLGIGAGILTALIGFVARDQHPTPDTTIEPGASK